MTFVNLIFVWTTFGQNFVVDDQAMSSPPAFKRHGQFRMGTKTKQTNSCSSSFSFMDLKLSYYIVIAAGA